MSNYPPGVTGNEYAIAGGIAVRGTRVEDVTHECDEEIYDAEFEGEVEIDDLEVYGGNITGFYTCPQCAVEVTWAGEVEDERDPDEGRDDWE